MENKFENSGTSIDKVSLEKGLKDKLITARKQALEGLIQGPHSVELVGSISGVDYLNDSKSTFLDASLRTISTLEKPVVWMIGTSLNLPSQEWFTDIMKKHVKAAVLFGNGGPRAMERARASFRFPYHMDSVRTATFLAREVAESGDIVLFSPGCMSKPDFANYEERGAEFKRSVKDL